VPNLPLARILFWTHVNFYVTWVMCNLVLVRLEIVSILMQDRYIVCAKHTIGSEINLDVPSGTPR
jgi:hypothetical protein